MIVFVGVMAVLTGIGCWATERVDAPRRRQARSEATTATA